MELATLFKYAKFLHTFCFITHMLPNCKLCKRKKSRCSIRSFSNLVVCLKKIDNQKNVLPAP